MSSYNPNHHLEPGVQGPQTGGLSDLSAPNLSSDLDTSHRMSFDQLDHLISQLEMELCKIPTQDERVPKILIPLGNDFISGFSDLLEKLKSDRTESQDLVRLFKNENRNIVIASLVECFSTTTNLPEFVKSLKVFLKNVPHYTSWKKELRDNPLIHQIPELDLTYTSIGAEEKFKSRADLNLPNFPNNLKSGQIFLLQQVPLVLQSLRRSESEKLNIYEKISEDLQALLKADKSALLASVYFRAIAETSNEASFPHTLRCFIQKSKDLSFMALCALTSENAIATSHETNLYLRDILIRAQKLKLGELVGEVLLRSRNPAEKAEKLIELINQAISEHKIKPFYFKKLFKGSGASALINFLEYANQNPQAFTLFNKLASNGISAVEFVDFMKRNSDTVIPFDGRNISLPEFIYENFKTDKAFRLINLVSIIKRGGRIFTEKAFEEDLELLVKTAISVVAGDKVLSKYTEFVEDESLNKARVLLRAALQAGTTQLGKQFFMALDSLTENACEVFLQSVLTGTSSIEDKLNKLYIRTIERTNLQPATQQTRRSVNLPWFTRLLINATKNPTVYPPSKLIRDAYSAFPEDLETQRRVFMRMLDTHSPACLRGFCEDVINFANSPMFRSLIADAGLARIYFDELVKNIAISDPEQVTPLLKDIRRTFAHQVPDNGNTNIYLHWNELLLGEDEEKAIPCKPEVDTIPSKPSLAFNRILIIGRGYSHDAINNFNSVFENQPIEVILHALPKGYDIKKDFGFRSGDLVIYVPNHLPHAQKAAIFTNLNGATFKIFPNSGTSLLIPEIQGYLAARKSD